MVQATNTPPQSVAQWKRKYYDSLEAFERKEEQWSEVENLLRKTLSRLTLAADGLHPALDVQLKALRNAIREQADQGHLRRRIDAMSEALVKLDQQRSEASKVPATAQVLQQLLDQLALPKSLGREVKALKQQLQAAIADPSRLLAAIEAFAQLMIRGISEHDAAGVAPVGKASTGLLGRLFNKSADNDAAPVAAPSQASGDAVELARAMLLKLLAQLAPQLQQSEQADALRGALQKVQSGEEMERLAEQLAGLLRTGEAAAGDTAAGDTQHPVIHEVLLELVERLQLPAEMQDQVDELKQRLTEPGEDAPWGACVEQLADLIAQMRIQLQRDKRDIEEFLQQLTDQLQQVDQHLQGAESMREESYQSSRALSDRVKDQVQGIGTSVQDAADLDQLKLLVQDRIQLMLSHMDEHRSEEEQRHQQVLEQVEQLTEQLGVMEDETASLQNRIREERHLALTDALTHIPNRLAYDERIAQEYARWKRFDPELTLLVWDVDHFKKVNDEYGHKAGDLVLTTIAGILADGVRETDFVARYGGEEFVMIMTGTDAATAMTVADKLRLAVAQAGFHFRGTQVSITISCGISEFAANDTPTAVFERADATLYQAKQKGRNRCCTA